MPVSRGSGGIYLFDNQAAAQAFIDGPILARLRASARVRDYRVALTPVREGVSRITRAPLAP